MREKLISKNSFLFLLFFSIFLLYIQGILHRVINAYFPMFNLLIFWCFIFLFIIALAFVIFSKLKNKIKFLSITILLFVVWILYRGHLISVSNHLFFYLVDDNLSEFVMQVDNYGKIVEMDNRKQYLGKFNNHLITFDSTKTDTLREKRPIIYWENALAKEGVDPAIFNQFKEKLRQLGLHSFYRHDNYIDFSIDGHSGIVYSKVKEKDLKANFRSHSSRVRRPHLQRIEDRWYIY